jgi:hypothetical protein
MGLHTMALLRTAYAHTVAGAALVSFVARDY